MKKLITLFASACILGTAAQAQTITNASFENWTTVGSYETPDSWDNFNVLTSPFSVYTCEKGTTGAPHGNAFIKLTTKTAGTNTVPGLAMYGKYDAATQKPKHGYPYAGRPHSLTGRWQYMASGADQGRIAVYLTKWNATTNKRDEIASVEYDLPGMAMAWTAFSIPLTYVSGATPDSVIIGLVSSNKTSTAVAGSYLWVDSLNFSGTVAAVPGMADVKNGLTLSPNPAKDRLSIELSTAAISSVTAQLIYMNGKLITETAWDKGKSSYTMSLKAVAPGLYFVKVQIGEDVHTERLVIQ